MGWGDEIIASGQARVLQEKDPTRRVVVRDQFGRIRGHAIWANNPRIIGVNERIVGKAPHELRNAPGYRPYIAQKTEAKWFWNDWDCPVGEIYFSPEEVAFGEQYEPGVIVEPFLKEKASPNKDWGRQRWQDLVHILRARGYRVTQLGIRGTQVLAGAQLIETPSFRHACAVLARARAAVLPEGGLHHAAAALGVKSVVIFGGFISPRQTGYATQTNLFTGGVPCGMRAVRCSHCEEAFAKIPPALVADKLSELLE